MHYINKIVYNCVQTAFKLTEKLKTITIHNWSLEAPTAAASILKPTAVCIMEVIRAHTDKMDYLPRVFLSNLNRSVYVQYVQVYVQQSSQSL